MLDELIVVDGSKPGLDPIIAYSKGRVSLQMNDLQVPQWFKKYLPELYQKALLNIE